MKTPEDFVQEILAETKGMKKENKWTYYRKIQRRLTTEMVKLVRSKGGFDWSQTNRLVIKKPESVQDSILSQLRK